MDNEGNQQETVGDNMLSEYSKFVEPSKLPKKRIQLHYYLVGFADAEGCFSVALKKQKDTRFGWVLDPVFHVTQHEKNRAVLELFKAELKCGRIEAKHGQEHTLQFTVDNRRQLAEKVIPFFERRKLLVKSDDFRLFERIVSGLEKKEHANLEKFKYLITQAFKMNLDGKQRRYTLSEVLDSLAGSSETTRQTPQK